MQGVPRCFSGLRGSSWGCRDHGSDSGDLKELSLMGFKGIRGDLRDIQGLRVVTGGPNGLRGSLVCEGRCSGSQGI